MYVANIVGNRFTVGYTICIPRAQKGCVSSHVKNILWHRRNAPHFQCIILYHFKAIIHIPTHTILALLATHTLSLCRRLLTYVWQLLTQYTIVSQQQTIYTSNTPLLHVYIQVLLSHYIYCTLPCTTCYHTEYTIHIDHTYWLRPCSWSENMSCMKECLRYHQVGCRRYVCLGVYIL